MTISDTLLINRIQKDMQQKGIAEENYYIAEDNTLITPKNIAVKINEVVYVCYFHTHLLYGGIFNIQLISGTATSKYTFDNTTITTSSAGFHDIATYRHESSVITSHWSTVKVKNLSPLPINFFLRYIKVVFTPTISNPTNE